jgi:YD repeat-containing protein
VTSVVAPKGNISGATPADWTTTITYNADSQPLVTTEHASASTTFTTTRTYDGDGNLETVTDPNNHTTEYVYDAGDQLVQVIRPDSSVIVNSYWPDGQLKAQKDGSNTQTALYDHDAQGRLTSVTDALNRTTALGYDAAGNLVSKADPGGSCPASGTGTACTRFAYDAAGQRTGITYSDGTTPNVTFTYRANGQRATMVDGTGTTTYVYDSLGRLTSSTDGAGAAVTYGYNLRDLLTTIGYPGLGTVTRAWDDAGRIDTVTDWASRVFDYSHDANGNVTDIAFPSGTGNIDTFTYDHADRMASSVHKQGTTTLASLDYGRDLAGQLTSVDQTGLPGSDQTYGYSALDQLCYAAPSGTGTCSSPPTGATTYGYDAADNLMATATAATQRFDAANQLCWSSTAASTNACGTPPTGATTYSFDTRGNRTATTPSTATATTYTYDQANRLSGTSGAITSSYS